MKMRNYYLPLVGAFCLLLISFGSIAEQDPPGEELPPGSLGPCESFGYAQVGRYPNTDFNNVNGSFCSCEATGWFAFSHPFNKTCVEVME
tara:strand:+ start:475 stop:744 length:270 start_codon:yes stop_codon:yes gene_type:complete